ncbi:hypothetical protein GLAREA_12742 [Glarea lozoyensis ATCC 20868]|uniref:Uncharacterized protein n=1 Tax=Glarea lozoyensis (strain ATCC 20868 / MF5171) TaxID=1116229 RepID=S3D2P8_GLAL2|nr:uncharacterized protein GLAREA_12742 [Glarea lozoyensis ATCC 20868]EPE31439.1 hypothetical protein GLAREA_12742 [Glarea lozoyensis ATCC 20868]
MGIVKYRFPKKVMSTSWHCKRHKPQSLDLVTRYRRGGRRALCWIIEASFEVLPSESSRNSSYGWRACSLGG